MEVNGARPSNPPEFPTLGIACAMCGLPAISFVPGRFVRHRDSVCQVIPDGWTFSPLGRLAVAPDVRARRVASWRHPERSTAA